MTDSEWMLSCVAASAVATAHLTYLSSWNSSRLLMIIFSTRFLLTLTMYCTLSFHLLQLLRRIMICDLVPIICSYLNIPDV